MDSMKFKPVIQQDMTGCAFASTAVLAGADYRAVKQTAGKLGIYTHDPRLWSEVTLIQKLLGHYKIQTSKRPVAFRSWNSLPDVALLATKWHYENNRPCWHWVVFARRDKHSCVFDSRKSLQHHCRTDFGRIKPKWYLRIIPGTLKRDR